MNKKLFLAVIAIFAAVLSANAQSTDTFDEITEENFEKLESAIWTQYEQDIKAFRAELRKNPEKEDSLLTVFEKITDFAAKNNAALALKFSSLPSALPRLFALRLNIPKDTLSSIFTTLPDSLANSPYAKSILYHIQSEQIKEGDNYYDFDAVTTDGQPFKLSSLEGKNILFLYGGLGCMGEGGRDYLDSVYTKTAGDDFEIVVYCLVSDLENLRKEQEIFNCKFLLVSDFLLNHSPVKILYGAQATPTCFFINKQGVVEMKAVGLQKRLQQLLLSLSKNN